MVNEKYGHSYITLQTGPWEGPRSWLYRIWCPECGFKDYATNYEDADEARRQHRIDTKDETKESADDEVWEDF